MSKRIHDQIVEHIKSINSDQKPQKNNSRSGGDKSIKNLIRKQKVIKKRQKGQKRGKIFKRDNKDGNPLEVQKKTKNTQNEAYVQHDTDDE